jgi:pimeloyl-ACP methyl ester carboxylesterase
MRVSTCETITVRGLRYNLRRWGDAGARPILFLHGARDSSITFQFVVDHLKADWQVIAPDWCGHGRSEWDRHGYWFHDFVADLDTIVDLLFPGSAVPIVGHSLGGNVAGAFAGLRPDRLSHLVSLDGFGPLTDRERVDMPALLTDFLNDQPRVYSHKGYDSRDQIAQRLRQVNPRLTPERADFLALQSADIGPDGRYRWQYDLSFSITQPTLHTLAEWGAIWSQIRVPVCWLGSSDRRPHDPAGVPDAFEARKAMVPGLVFSTLAETSHNLHHDAPGQVAAAIEAFLLAP